MNDIDSIYTITAQELIEQPTMNEIDYKKLAAAIVEATREAKDLQKAKREIAAEQVTRDRIESKILRLCENGHTIGRLLNKFRSHSGERIQAILNDMVESGLINAEQVQNSRGGHQTVKYFTVHSK
jgi:predicted transcriptional regulator